jgi:hypothetical protein
MEILKTNMQTAIIFLLIGMLEMANAAATEDKVSLHGYGDTAVIRAVENNYTNRYNGTNWNYNYLSVNITAQVDDKTKIVAQIRQGSEIVGDMGAYVNFNATDNLTARAGQIKAPIGIFNEIRDIKFLQLSVLTPLMYQDATGLLPDSFKGVESIYHLDMGAHRLIFDIYGGEPKGSNEYVNQGQVAASTYFYVLVQNIYGGRLTYKTPIGLKFSLSAVQDDLLSVVSGSAPTSASIPDQGVRRLSTASIDYNKNNFDIKMEYARLSQFQGTASENNGKAYYGQMGYTFADKVTPYIRYDYVLYDDNQVDNPSYYQKAKVFGITYRINSNISMRMENQWNNGYAIPSHGANFVAANAKEDWNIFAMGLNFIF